MLLIRAGCSLSFLPEKRAGKAFSTASLSAPLKLQLDNDHKAVPGWAISIACRVILHRGCCFTGICIFRLGDWEHGMEIEMKLSQKQGKVPAKRESRTATQGSSTL